MNSASTDWAETPVWAVPLANDPPLAAPPPPPPAATSGRHRRRWLILTAVAVGVLLAAVVVVEAVGRSVAQREIAGRLGEAGITGDVEVTVGLAWWRPSILPALLGGDLDQVEINIVEGALLGIPVERAEYILTGISGTLSLLDGSVDVSSVDEGSVQMWIHPDVVGNALGLSMAIRDGRVVVGPDELPATLEVVGDSLVVSGPGVADGGKPPWLPLADPYILPCSPEVSLGQNVIDLSCIGSSVPGILRGPLRGTPPGNGGTAPVGELPPPQSIDRPAG